jgi:hypothetical protein
MLLPQYSLNGAMKLALTRSFIVPDECFKAIPLGSQHKQSLERLRLLRGAKQGTYFKIYLETFKCIKGYRTRLPNAVLPICGRGYGRIKYSY